MRWSKVLGELLGDRGAALHHAAGAGICHQRAHQARRVDAEMLVEAAIFRGQRRLDQMVGEILERDRIVVADAAAADLVAVAAAMRLVAFSAANRFTLRRKMLR